MKSIDRKVSVIRQRRKTIHKLIERYDASDDDIQWITMNGTHIPLKDGKAIGGPENVQNLINGGNGRSGAKSGSRNTSYAESLKSSWESEDLEGVESNLKSAVSEMKIGDSFDYNRSTTTKIGEDQFLCEDPFGNKETSSSQKLVEDIVDTYDPDSFDAPVFKYGNGGKTSSTKKSNTSGYVDMEYNEKNYNSGEWDRNAIKAEPMDNPEWYSYTYERRPSGLIYCRAANGWCINTGRDYERLKKDIEDRQKNQGPMFTMRPGDKRTFSTKGLSQNVMKNLVHWAAEGSTLISKDKVYTRDGDGWWRYRPKANIKSHSSTWGTVEYISSDIIENCQFEKMTLIKRNYH